jgi:hypothetical protein
MKAYADTSAFPVANERGMTLRDYFAAKAIQGVLANSSFDTIEGMMNASIIAYMMADAMLQSRDRK